MHAVARHRRFFGIAGTATAGTDYASASGTVTIAAGGDFPLPAPDQRRRAARLVQAELQPTKE